LTVSLSAPALWLTATERGLLLIGLAMAIGGLAGRAVAANYRGEFPAPLPGPWALRGSLLGLLASVALIITALAGPRLAAELARPPVAGARAHGTVVFAVVELVCFAIAALLLRRQSSRAVQPLIVAAFAEAFRSHPEGMLPIAGALLAACHLLPALTWAGMLLYVLRAALAWRRDPAAMRGVIQLYASAAAWLFGVVVVTGVILALLLVRNVDSLVSTTYGRILLVKAALVLVAAGLAVAGRAWLRRPGGRRSGPARATRAEAVALIAVLVITAILTVISPPAKPTFQAGAAGRPGAVARSCQPASVGHNDPSWRSPSTSTP
jgi:copper transport protein